MDRDVVMPGRLGAFRLPREDAVRACRWYQAILGDEDAARWCQSEGLLTRAQTESVNSAGGALVPEEVERAIVSYRNLSGTLRQRADVRPMGSDARILPRGTGGLTASWVAQNTSLTESAAAFDAIGLNAKKLAALTKSSSELYEDETADLGDWLSEEIAYAFASKEDAAGFNGDGTQAYSGITGICVKLLQSTSAGSIITATGHSTALTFDATDLTNLMATLPEQFWGNAAWFCSGYIQGACFLTGSWTWIRSCSPGPSASTSMCTTRARQLPQARSSAWSRAKPMPRELLTRRVTTVRALAVDRQVVARINDESPASDGFVLLRSGLRAERFMANPVVQWSHLSDIPPIARVLNLYDGPRNGETLATVQFPREGTSGLSDQLYRLIREGVINAVSCGFSIDRSETRGGVRYATNWTLYELSFVNVGALPSALILERAGKTISAASHSRLTGHLDRIVAECASARDWLDSLSGDDDPCADPDGPDYDPAECAEAEDRARRRRDLDRLRLAAAAIDDVIDDDAGREQRRRDLERLRQGA
jgi:hypothetical protein